MLLIKNGILNTMEDRNPFKGDILVKNGKIVEISENIKQKEYMERLDANGMNVFPGFIDPHSHIGICEEKATVPGDVSNESTNPVTPYIRGIDAVNPMDSAFHNALAVGITGVMVGPGSANPIGGQFAFIKTYGRCIDDMIVKAPAAIKIAFGENPKRCYRDKSSSSRMDIAST